MTTDAVDGHIEHLVSVVRVPGGYGTPYEMTVTLRYFNPWTVELMCLVGQISFQNGRRLKRLLKAAGIREARIRHYEDGQERWTVIKEQA